MGHVGSVKTETTSDRTQVGLTSGLARFFKKPTLPEQAAKPIEDIYKSKTILGKQGRNMAGLGSHKEVRINNSPVDFSSLSKPGVGITPESLNQLESVQMVYHSALKEHIMLYFMEDGRVYQIRQKDISVKYYEELQNVLFLLKVKNKSTHDAAEFLKSIIQKKSKLSGSNAEKSYSTPENSIR